MYLKLFEEHNIDNRRKFASDLKDFCETYLVELLDKGFYIIVVDGTESDSGFRSYKVVITLPRPHKVSWDEIKDNFIPFFKILDRRYVFKKLTIDEKIYNKINRKEERYYIKLGYTFITKDEIIDDKVPARIKREGISDWLGGGISFMITRLKNKNDV